MPDRRNCLLALAAGAYPFGMALAQAQAPGDMRTAVRQHGLVVLLRHAATDPGVGDPPGWTLDDCRSQRQLSTAGRAQASALGPALAAQGIKPKVVKSSRWCRCLDTARLAFGRVEPWTALDSFFEQREREPAQTAALRTALAAVAPGEVQAWVTHQVNISALTGEGAGMGEALLLAGGAQPSGGVRVLRRV